ncbi:putative ribonuclease H-like domain-containing protein [Tanacetum coccineum]
MVPRAVLMKSGLVSVNTARQVNATHSKITMNSARPMTNLSKLAHSTVKWPIHKNTTFKNRLQVSDGLGSQKNKEKIIFLLSKVPDYEEIDRGYVAFKGNPKGGKITGRVPRKNNMYSIDLKNIIPKEGLTCLFAKATSDESELWHTRLGHINFKTMNKLVKRNLVQKHVMMHVKLEWRQYCKDYILLPLWTADPPFSQSLKSSPDDRFKPSEDNEKSILTHNRDDHDLGAEADMNNLDAFMHVSPIPTTRVHKDHPVEQIIGDLNLAPQTRRMIKNLELQEVWTLVKLPNGKQAIVVPNGVFKSAFLYGKIEEEVYVCQPPGFEDPDFPNRVLERKDRQDFVYQKGQRLQVKQKEDENFISLDKYVTEILKKFGFTDVMIASTPIETQKLLLKDEDDEEVDVHLYRSMIDSLMYLTSSRPDIMFAVCACARYQVNPKVSHLHAIKRIFRYLKGQLKLGLWYLKDSPFDLVAYTDSDYARASLDRKSTTGDNVTDEAVYKEIDDSLERAATTATSLDAEQDREVREERRVKNSQAQKIYKVGRSAKVISSDEASLGDQENASKQGRKIDDIDKDVEITLVHETQERYGDEEMFDNVVEEPSESITTTPTLTTTTTVTTIIAVSTRPRAKGLVIHKEEQATTLTVSSQQPSQVKAQDKGKGIMLQAEEEEERLAKEKAQREEEANIVSWDNVQAMIDVDYQMAQQMQAEEQEKLSIEEKSKLFVQLLEARKKHFAAIRAKEKRNKPPTKAQKRNTMSTYLKNMVGYKHNQLKNKSFDDIQKLFDKAIKRVNTFVDMDTELVEGSEVRAEAEIAQESSSKRAGTELEQESIKKQKVDEDKETAELQRLIEVVPDKEEVAIDAIPLATKPPSIVDYKIHKEGKKTYYQIIRADRSSKMYLVFSHMLKSFDREDLETLWKLVKAKHGSTRPEEGYERVLWGDLKTMFDPHVEDQVWRNQ